MKHSTLHPLTAPITATVSIPGSKSYTNRALIMAAMTDNPVTILNPLFSDDTEAMIRCLQALGVEIRVADDRVEVVGSVRNIQHKEYDLNANLSGTTIRFILALACLVPGVKIVRGEEGLNKRPIGDLVNGLRQLGAEIEYVENERFPPLKVKGHVILNSFQDQDESSRHKLTKNATQLHGDISSQYFSALLMVAPLMNGITINVEGNQISKSYIDMTIDMMNDWGVKVMNENYQKYSVAPDQQYAMKEYVVEGDYSGAGYFFAIAALTKSTLTLRNLNPNSKQGDLQFAKILEKMGNKLLLGDNELTIIGNGVQPIQIDMEQCPDQAQTLSVLAAFAPGVTTMTGVRSLRVKETERVKATQAELAKMGIKTESPNADTLIIHGGNPQPAAIDTYGDHRMAMAFAVAACKIPGMIINNPEVVNKTFPNYWEKLEELGMDVEE